jgi:YebC/PmpR family DNA-binding regulatory protein
MSGHSKWHNIQRRKGKQDSVRGQLFTKLSRDVYQAAKEGGGNPDTNFRLKVTIERARQSNLPADNIARTIAKATGSLPGVSYEELIYEGYGPHGVAVMMEIVTDNRNRTAADVRHIFTKRGGNLGESGCVSWMFDRIGFISIRKDNLNIPMDDLLLLTLEAGAEDFRDDGEDYVITTQVETFTDVRQTLETANVPLEDAELTYEPKTTIALQGDALESLLDLVDALQALDDVQNVYANFESADGEAE